MTAVTHAITVRPPWSWAIAEAAALTALGVTPKLIENRGGPVLARRIGQRIAIHAGLKWCQTGERNPHIRAAWTTFAEAIHPHNPNPRLAAIGDTRTGVVGRMQPGLWMDTGAVVAVATVADCHQAVQASPRGTCCAPWGQREYQTARGLGPAYHLVLADVRRLPVAVPCRGQQSVPWRMPEDVAEQVATGHERAVNR